MAGSRCSRRAARRCRASAAAPVPADSSSDIPRSAARPWRDPCAWARISHRFLPARYVQPSSTRPDRNKASTWQALSTDGMNSDGIKRGGRAVVKTVATSFRDGAKRRARNPKRHPERCSGFRACACGGPGNDAVLFAPPPNFLDDDAVVALGLAGPHAGLQHVAMHLEHRQLLPEPFALIEHHMHVLERLLDAALRREVPGPHFFALGL